MRLYFAGSEAFAGLFDAPTLVKLVEDFGVTFDATFPEQNPKSKSRNGASSLIPTAIVHIMVYGNRTHMYEVGDLLSDAGFYLQHPQADIDPRVEYFNPQYLLAPGETFPRQAAASSPGRGKDHPLGEIVRAQIMGQFSQVFDAANGPGQYVVVEQSRRLKTTLQEQV